ncbi:MAG: DUF368 domain-containing protein [Bacilli bacterium]|nr:DUF368 domain-containing protein [Bacilli bacterium]
MKKDNYLIIFIKSFIVGLGIIFPISASYLAIGLGIYKRLLDDINNLKTGIKKDFKFLLTFAIGIVFSALVSCLLINFTLKKFPVATLLCFTGLIIGGIPELFKKTKKEYKLSNFIWLIIGILLLVGISFFKTESDVILQTTFAGLAKIFGAGALAAGSMMIPGVSGSALLVIIGFYEPMLAVISETVKFTNLNTNILIIAIFGIGMIMGILLISKLMGYFLEKHETKTYFAVIGFVGASAINIIISLFGYTCSTVQIVIGLLLFAIGFILSFKFLKE